MVERVDFYSEDEYQQALQWEEAQYKEQQALAEYEAEYVYQEYLKETK
jgi:hypothetical protein